MIVKSLSQMENIVKSNKNLSWDGWNVVYSYPSDKARTSKDGAFINSKWMIKKEYAPSRMGWEIPNKFVE